MQEAGWRYCQDLGGSWEDKRLVPLGVRDPWVLSSDPTTEVTPKSLSLSRTCPCLLYSLFVEVGPPASSQLPKGEPPPPPPTYNDGTSHCAKHS